MLDKELQIKDINNIKLLQNTQLNKKTWDRDIIKYKKFIELSDFPRSLWLIYYKKVSSQKKNSKIERNGSSQTKKRKLERNGTDSYDLHNKTQEGEHRGDSTGRNNLSTGWRRQKNTFSYTAQLINPPKERKKK